MPEEAVAGGRCCRSCCCCCCCCCCWTCCCCCKELSNCLLFWWNDDGTAKEGWGRWGLFSRFFNEKRNFQNKNEEKWKKEDSFLHWDIVQGLDHVVFDPHEILFLFQSIHHLIALNQISNLIGRLNELHQLLLEIVAFHIKFYILREIVYFDPNIIRRERVREKKMKNRF